MSLHAKCAVCLAQFFLCEEEEGGQHGEEKGVFLYSYSSSHCLFQAVWSLAHGLGQNEIAEQECREKDTSIGHFRVQLSLYFETSLSENSLLWIPMFFSKHMDPKMVQQKQSKSNLTTELRLMSDL